MIRFIRRVRRMVAIIILVSTATGCSVFISTPRVARIQMQQLDDKFIEYEIDLDGPCQSNMGIRLNNAYWVQLDFHWIWYLDERFAASLSADEDVNVDADADAANPQLTPWMLCEYRF